MRRTGATLSSENGMSPHNLQVAGGWKSEKVSKSYIDNSEKQFF
jgi:hypothetical protein